MNISFRLGKKIYLVLLVIICLLGITLNNTYARFTSEYTTDGTIAELNYDFNIGISDIEEFELISVNGGDYITFNVDITNSYDSTLYYGVWYNIVEADDTSNVTIAKLDTSANETSGSIDTDTTITVTVIIINNSSDYMEVKIGVGSSITSTDDIDYINDNTLITLTESVPFNTLLSEYVTNLYSSATKTSVTTAGEEKIKQATDVNLMEDSYGNIRYYGTSPNNYVSFNGELWRIIGVFEVEDEDGNTESRVKIVRDESIGNYGYDLQNYLSDWGQSSLMKMLNDGYYDDSTSIGSLYWNKASGYCYYGLDSFDDDYSETILCDFTNIGLNDTAKSLIGETRYNLGGMDDDTWYNGYTNEWYKIERGTMVSSGQSTEWTGYVGLIYPSDYGYATDLSICKETVYNYITSECYNNDWIFGMLDKDDYMWVISSYLGSDAVGVFYADTSGSISVEAVNFAASVFPTVYLNSKVIVSGGAGSSTNPFQISK